MGSPNPPHKFIIFAGKVNKYIGPSNQVPEVYEVSVVEQFQGDNVTGTITVAWDPGVRHRLLDVLQSGETYIFSVTHNTSENRYAIFLVETPEQCISNPSWQGPGNQ